MKFEIKTAEEKKTEILIETKTRKIAELNSYYKSDELRRTTTLGFTFVNNSDFRNTIQEQITMAETTGESYFNYITTDNTVEITVEKAKALLGQLIKIATANFVKKDEKTKEVDGLETVEEVKNYDVTSGFIIEAKL